MSETVGRRPTVPTDPTPAPPAGPVLGEEAYDEILARIREPGAYVEQPHRYRAVWQAAAVARYVAALVAVAEQRGAEAERARIEELS